MNLAPTTLDAEARSVRATIATEEPVPMWDYARGEVIPEVLLAEGAEWPARGVPLLDSHDRSSVGHQKGSVRGIRREGDVIGGDLVFSTTADREFTLATEGHLTDVSVGYRVKNREYVPRGESRVIRGRTFKGPVNVATKWRIYESSLTPIGADQLAKLRGLGLGGETGEPIMDDDAQDTAAKQPEVRADNKIIDIQPGMTPQDIAKAVAEEVDRLRKAEQEAREKHRSEVRDLCGIARLEPLSRYDDLPIAEVKKDLLTRQTEGGVSRQPAVNITGEGRDRQREAMRAALVQRCLLTGASQRRREVAREIAAEDLDNKDASDFRGMGLLQLSRESLILDGFDERRVRMASNEHVARAALGFVRGTSLETRHGDPAYHVTGSFPQLTLDAMNKTLRAGYEETPATWRTVFRQGASVQDFKTIHRMQLSAIGNVPLWPNNTVPQQLTMSDAREAYAVEAHAGEVSFSWRLLVNDDMDALMRTPASMGTAMARTINTTVWSIITANPNMADGNPLFTDATGVREDNLVGSTTAAPSVTTLQNAAVLMRLQRGVPIDGVRSEEILGTQPKFLVGPAELETVIMQLVNSTADPAASGNAGVYNTGRTYTPVIEPLLSANSATRWYLFCEPGVLDTIEVTFLQGQESPAIRDYRDERTMALNYAIVQTFGCKALDWRGMVRHGT